MLAEAANREIAGHPMADNETNCECRCSEHCPKCGHDVFGFRLLTMFDDSKLKLGLRRCQHEGCHYSAITNILPNKTVWFPEEEMQSLARTGVAVPQKGEAHAVLEGGLSYVFKRLGLL